MANDQLLSLFDKVNGAYLSGEEISRQLGVSRTAVWKQIRKLEAQGYKFEASRRLGYKLLDIPDQLSLTELASSLMTKSFGQTIKLYDTIDSTQNKAQQLAEQGAAEGTLVLAEQQLSGRGRMGREWISPSGKGIWMSMVLRPIVPIHYAPQLTLMTAVALCRTLKRHISKEITIKWPNDLLIDGKKISGILLESAAEDERLRYVTAGIGISVNLEAADYPPQLLDKVTSLRIAEGRKLDRMSIITDFLLEWEQLYTLHQDQGFSVIAALWEALSSTLNTPARLITPQGTIEGIPIGLAASGALIVEQANGHRAEVFSAEMGEPLPSS
ncbi:biotin--[acetyl-CoA-carboxylase] ligase [Paenibacillus sp. GCM10023252]|uniref:biotin--[acetyl-CoA-carboxylase] ligase n=1 Tax=Paenibacillus sp. GCM10023252 TaxID=3252649 RepID=UPI003614119C